MAGGSGAQHSVGLAADHAFLVTAIINPDRHPVDPMISGPWRRARKGGALRASRLRASRMAREASAQPRDVVCRKLADQWLKPGQRPAGRGIAQ